MIAKTAEDAMHELATLGELNLQDRDRPRPNITNSVRLHLDRHLQNSVTVLYPPRDIDILPPDPSDVDLKPDLMPEHHEQINTQAQNEEILGEVEKITAYIRQGFWALQKQLNKASATVPTFDDTCRYLGLDLIRPAVSEDGPVTLTLEQRVFLGDDLLRARALPCRGAAALRLASVSNRVALRNGRERTHFARTKKAAVPCSKGRLGAICYLLRPSF